MRIKLPFLFAWCRMFKAGIEGVVKPIVDYPEEMFDKVIAVNVRGVWLGNRYVLPK